MIKARESWTKFVMAGHLDARARDEHRIIDPDEDSDDDLMFDRCQSGVNNLDNNLTAAEKIIDDMKNQ